MVYKIFLAWQSQNKTTADFIRSQIRQAVSVLGEKGYAINLIERPTQEDSGSPNINSLIWEQISDSDIFIADISDVIQNGDTIISNPNVMYELGIAEALLGSYRTILLCDEHTPINKLAFDINHNRISPIKTSNNKLFLNLSEWIEAALIESDKERYIKTYAVDALSEELILLTNFFYCFSDMRTVADKNIVFPTLDMIRESLTIEQYSNLFVNVNFHNLIQIMEEKLQKLYVFSNKKLVWHTVNIIQSLKDYQFILDNLNDSPWVKIENKTVDYIFLDNNSFYIKDMLDTASLKISVYLNPNVIIYGNGTRLFATDKRLLKEVDIKYQHIESRPGEKMTMIKTNMFTLKSELIEVFAKHIYNIFHALIAFFEYCNIELCITDNEGNFNGIIAFKHK